MYRSCHGPRPRVVGSDHLPAVAPPRGQKSRPRHTSANQWSCRPGWRTAGVRRHEFTSLVLAFARLRSIVRILPAGCARVGDFGADPRGLSGLWR